MAALTLAKSNWVLSAENSTLFVVTSALMVPFSTNCRDESAARTFGRSAAGSGHSRHFQDDLSDVGRRYRRFRGRGTWLGRRGFRGLVFTAGQSPRQCYNGKRSERYAHPRSSSSDIVQTHRPPRKRTGTRRQPQHTRAVHRPSLVSPKNNSAEQKPKRSPLSTGPSFSNLDWARVRKALQKIRNRLSEEPPRQFSAGPGEYLTGDLEWRPAGVAGRH